MSAATPDRGPHFSMLRGFHLADVFTLANAACGMLAVFATIRFVETRAAVYLYTAVALVPLALVFDTLDGRVARWRRQHSVMGRELDSLADVISFGVAPAAIAYGAGLRGLWDIVILAYFTACGVSRLARFNVTAEALSQGGDKVKYFEGTPITTSLLLALLVAGLAWAGRIGDALPFGAVQLGPGTLRPIALLWAVSGSLMISKTIRIPKI